MDDGKPKSTIDRPFQACSDMYAMVKQQMVEHRAVSHVPFPVRHRVYQP